MNLPEATAETAPVVAVPVYPEVWDLELGAVLSVLRLAGGAGHTVARSRASVLGAGGLVTTPSYIFAALPECQAVFVPGGPGAAKAARDPLLREFLQAASRRGVPIAACGSGLLPLGEAGVLDGKQLAATPELVDTVWGYGAADVQAGGVRTDAGIITARGGVGALEAALALVSLLWDETAAREVAGRLGYSWHEQQ